MRTTYGDKGSESSRRRRKGTWPRNKSEQIANLVGLLDGYVVSAGCGYLSGCSIASSSV